MSLTYILKKQSGRTYLKKWFRYRFPNPKLKKNIEIIVSPLQTDSSYTGEVGTAFDYLVRFNLERINQKTYQDASWIAERGLERILLTLMCSKGKKIYIGYYKDKKVDKEVFKNYLLDEFEKANDLYKVFIKDGQLSRELIKATIFLAKLDVSSRTGIVDSGFYKIEDKKIIEIEQLFNIMPWQKFKTNKNCILNPTFGIGSSLVNGADADLIIDNTLIDIKTTRFLKIKREDLNQIIGYHLLSIIGGIDSKKKIEIKNIGIYFARFGYLWKMPLTDYYELECYKTLADEFKTLVKNKNLGFGITDNDNYQKTAMTYKQSYEYEIDENDFKCPFCKSKNYVKHGKTSNKFRYKCKGCNKNFSSEISSKTSNDILKNITL